MIAKAKPPEKVEPRPRFVEARGGRKTAAARARLVAGVPGITVNDRDYRQYFRERKDQVKVASPLELLELTPRTGATVRVRGSGIHAQAEAVRNAVSRALVAMDGEFRKRLRKAGFLTRDARAVERKKYGLKKARRAPQWQKR